MTDYRMNLQPLVSCLCVTEDRPAFIPWLLWNYDRQSWAQRELVIIDSSVEPLVVDRKDVRVIRTPHRTGVARKRNLALEHARGEIVTWFDDDDWQHPQKLELLVNALSTGKPFAGSCEAWFLDLHTLKCKHYRAPARRILFNSAGFRTDVARRVDFPIHLKKASDTHWMDALRRRFGTNGEILDHSLFLWLCHNNNLSNPASRHRFTQDLAFLKKRFDSAAWGDTSDALNALTKDMVINNFPVSRIVGGALAATGKPQVAAKAPSTHNVIRSGSCLRPSPNRLGNNVMQKQSIGCNAQIVERSVSAADIPRDTAKAGVERTPITPVTAIVKATVLDAAYLGVMVPHMLRQARYPFAERIIVIDSRREFAGKYRSREVSPQRELDQVLDDLVARGEIDRVLEVSYDKDTVASVNRSYFGRPDVPTHATSGGPIYPTLWAMEQAKTDHVLQFDADIFFYSDGDSWVVRALEAMQRDPRLWLMMTHAGPPVGQPGRSIAGANLRRARWDAALEVWRFRTASTRFFLTDRRNLRGRLPKLGNGRDCRPLEQCISGALSTNNAFRGDVGNCRTWHLHAFSHAHPFSEWAPRLVESIKQGRYPKIQEGNYDLCLDRPSERAHWQALLFQSTASRATTSRRSCRSVRAKTKDPAPAMPQTGELAPIHVIVPVRDRSADRLRATLASLQWQLRRPSLTSVVSHGSSADNDTALEALCREHGINFECIGGPSDPWCKPAALNHGIRQTPPDIPYVMTLDADMILQPNFLQVVTDQLQKEISPGAMVLCRSCDLPRHLHLPRDVTELGRRFQQMRKSGRLRGRQGCGGIQAAPREFFFDVRGYDEEFIWWGEEDRDMVSRAESYGLKIIWIENQTSMLHQWHPHATSRDAKNRDAIAQALQRNRTLRKVKQGVVVRDNPGWDETLKQAPHTLPSVS